MMGRGFSGGGHVVSEEAPLIRTTLSSTSGIQRRVVILHTPQLIASRASYRTTLTRLGVSPRTPDRWLNGMVRAWGPGIGVAGPLR
jgi:hypothetical protein